MKDTPIKATSLSTSGGRGEHAEPAVLTSEAKVALAAVLGDSALAEFASLQ